MFMIAIIKVEDTTLHAIDSFSTHDPISTKFLFVFLCKIETRHTPVFAKRVIVSQAREALWFSDETFYIVGRR